MNGKTGNMRKCAVIGCVRAGENFIVALARENIFSEIVLIDQDQHLATHLASEIALTLPFLDPVNIYAGDYGDIADCRVIIIAETGSATDFAQTVCKIKCVGTDGILLISAPHSELLCSMAVRISLYPAERVIGIGTFLDTARLELMIGNHLCVNKRNVRAFVAGISDNERVALWSCASVSGIPIDRYFDQCGISCDKTLPTEFFEDIKLERSFSSSAVSFAVCEIIRALTADGDSVILIAVASGGAYGTRDVYLSLPCVVGRCRVKRIPELPITPEEEEKLCRASAKLFKKLCDLNSI